MKLKGIQSAHGRYAEHLRRQERDAPQPQQSVHKPEPQPDGTVACCGKRYAPHAHAAHLRDVAITDWRSGIGVIAADITPTTADELARARLYAEAADRKRGPQIAEGVDPNPYGW